MAWPILPLGIRIPSGRILHCSRELLLLTSFSEPSPLEVQNLNSDPEPPRESPKITEIRTHTPLSVSPSITGKWPVEHRLTFNDSESIIGQFILVLNIRRVKEESNEANGQSAPTYTLVQTQSTEASNWLSVLRSILVRSSRFT